MVRIWCVPIEELDRQHLLGEHKELHIIWSVIVNFKKGYSRHPETLRFSKQGHMGLLQLFSRHKAQVLEMRKRGYNHQSPLRFNGEVNHAEILFDRDNIHYVYSPEEYERDHTELLKRQNKQKRRP